MTNLDFKTSADIVIVGAGLHGAALAYHLARAGAKNIVVLEKRHIAAGPTAKSGAMIRPLFSDATYIRLVLEATAMFEQWDDIVGGDAGFVKNGFFRITDSLDTDRLGGDLDLMRQLGVPFELIANADLARIAPACVFEGNESGVLLGDGGFADAIKTTETLVAAARRLGVRFIEDALVTGIETSGGRVQAVTTATGRIATGLVVNCAGAWGDRVAAMVGVTLPIEIHRVPTALYRKPQSMRVAGPIVSDGVNQVYLRDAGESYFRAARFGWVADRVDPDTYDETIGRDHHDEVRRLVERRVPEMRRTPSVGGFSAIYDMTPDGHPIIGRIGDVDGFWCDCGWSGNGFASAPASGRHLATRILGGTSEVDLSAFAWPRPVDSVSRPDVNWVLR
ncbi:MAG: FAD-binding oxidoreductase [Hyphomicrobiales bacterium]|nr:MAG: FAD-binding oxidoreductase [Hyphomicrobiales bacterium]